MKISADVVNSKGRHEVALQTGDRRHSIAIPPKAEANGSDVNGGELLFLALATCFCNDLYREAAKDGTPIRGVKVSVEGDFGAAGEPARNIRYSVQVDSDAPPEVIEALVRQTDELTEIQNTVRASVPVVLER